MRSLAFGVVVALLGLTLGCGKSEADFGDPAPGGSSGTPGAGSGGAPASAGTSSAGSQSAGSETGGKPAGMAGQATSGGQASGGQPTGDAGDTGSGGAAALVDCDPKKIFCKRIAPQCAAGQVPSVDGNCYGECVKIEQCACSAADECPDPNQYTCWSKKHCGPFVR
jgi:hypothetical protein